MDHHTKEEGEGEVLPGVGRLPGRCQTHYHLDSWTSIRKGGSQFVETGLLEAQTSRLTIVLGS